MSEMKDIWRSAKWFQFSVEKWGDVVQAFPPAAVGLAVKAAVTYFQTGEEAEFGGEPDAIFAQTLFSMMMPACEAGWIAFEKKVEAGRAGGLAKSDNAKNKPAPDLIDIDEDGDPF